VENNVFFQIAKIAGHKRERYKTEPRSSVLFMLELEYESKVIKN